MSSTHSLAQPTTSTSHETVRFQFNLPNLVYALAALFLWFQVLQAPLRYELSQLHLDALVYLPKLLLFMAVLLLPLLRARSSPAALLLTGLVLVYLLWGMVNLPTPLQAMFGLWVLVPLLFGLWAGPVVRPEQWSRLFLVLFVVAAAGVFIDPLIHYPWSGQSMTILGSNVQISRQWTALGLQRYAGFSRASFDVASQLLLFGLMLVVLLRHRAIKLLVWFVAGAGIALTTSKGPLGAWLILSTYFLGGRLLGWPRYWIQLWLGCLGAALLAMILLPLSTLWIKYNPSFHGFASQFLFASFGDRLNSTWPGSLHLLDMGGNWHWWVGRGLGGIGAAQQYFEPAHYLPGDNLFVYVAVYVGLPAALLLFGALWLRIVRVSLRQDAAAWRLPVMLALVAYGVVVNEIEGAVLAFFLGLVLVSPNERKGLT